MTDDGAAVQRVRSPRLHESERLNPPERIALLVVVLGAAAFDLVVFFTTPDADPVRTAISVIVTLTFALYIWSPLIATLALGAAVALSFVASAAFVGMTPAALAAGLVTRLGRTPLTIGYAGGFLVATALFAYGVGNTSDTTPNVAVFLLLAAVSGGIGLALRFAYARGRRLETELGEQAERERQAVLAERRWIAGELHDSIAHHLTIVAMHAQLLDVDAARAQSQEAIRVAARKALSDLRFVITLAEDSPRGTEVLSGDLADSIEEAQAELDAAGHPTTCTGDPRDENIPRGAEIILARIVRESATNILKHAGPGPVDFGLDLHADSIELTVRSPLPETPRRDLPSSGTGLNRMAERTLGVQGEFHAGPDGNDWLVSVRLPVAGVLQPPPTADRR